MSISGRLPGYLGSIRPETRRMATDLVHRARFGRLPECREAIMRLAQDSPRLTTDLVMVLAYLLSVNTYPEELSEIQQHEAWMRQMHASWNSYRSTGGKPPPEVYAGESAYQKAIYETRNLRAEKGEAA